MDKDKQEKLAQTKSNEIFNSITENVKPENRFPDIRANPPLETGIFAFLQNALRNYK